MFGVEVDADGSLFCGLLSMMGQAQHNRFVALVGDAGDVVDLKHGRIGLTAVSAGRISGKLTDLR